MSISTNLMSQLQNQNALFNVREETLTTESGIILDNRKVLINESNNTPIGIVSNNYKTVSNEEIFSVFTKTLERTNINTDEAQINVKFSGNGAKTMVDFVFPNELIEVNGDQTALSITALNSFDGSTRYVTKAGGFRLKCLNGQILGNSVGAYSAFHNQKLDVEAGAEQLMEMLQTFQNAKEYWGQMLNKRVTYPNVLRIFAKFLNTDLKDEKATLRPNFQKLLTLWESYKSELGENVFALYNVLTDFITHKNYKEASTASAILKEQNKLSRLLESERVFQIAQ